MGLFSRFKEIWRGGSNTEKPALQPARPEFVEDTKSPEESLGTAVKKARSLQDWIGGYFQKVWQPKAEEKGEGFEAESTYRKVKGWVSRQIESAGDITEKGFEASEILDVMDYAKKFKLKGLDRRVDLTDPEFQQALAGLKGYQGLAAGEQAVGINIVSAVRGFRNKIEAANLLHKLHEKAIAEQPSGEKRKNQKEDETVLARLYSDVEEVKNGKAITYQDFQYMYSRAKEKFGMSVTFVSQAEFNEDPKAAKMRIVAEIEEWRRQKEQLERDNLTREIGELDLTKEKNTINIDAEYLTFLVKEARRLGVPFSAKVEVGSVGEN